MRYYIEGLYNLNINSLIDYLDNQYDEKMLLANDGFYKYINDELYKFKFCNNNEEDIKLIINGTTIIGSNIYWKKHESVNKIPFTFKFLEKKIYKFNITDNFTLVVEKMENSISNLYFTSKFNHEEYFFRQEFISFLSILNKYL